MGDVTTIGFGFQGDNSNRFASPILGQAAGSDAFYACVRVHVEESLLVAPTECAYFGNFNGVDAGWELGRAADVAASAPSTPELVTFRARFGAGGVVEDLTCAVDASSVFGRTYLLAVSVIGLVATLYLNGTAVAELTLSAPFNPGLSGLTYGNRSGGGARSGDPLISAAYTDTDAANFISNQRLLFDRLRGGGNLVASIAALNLEAAYVYESFSQRAPSADVPTLPFKNYGTSGVSGDLIFIGSTALVHTADSDPDYTGGVQPVGGEPPAASGYLQTQFLNVLNYSTNVTPDQLIQVPIVTTGVAHQLLIDFAFNGNLAELETGDINFELQVDAVPVNAGLIFLSADNRKSFSFVHVETGVNAGPHTVTVIWSQGVPGNTGTAIFASLRVCEVSV